MPNGFKPFCVTSARRGSELSRRGDNLDGTLSAHDPDRTSPAGGPAMAQRPWAIADGPWPMGRGGPVSRDLSVMGLWVLTDEL